MATTAPDLSKQLEQRAAPFAPKIGSFRAQVEAIEKRRNTRTTHDLAEELDGELKKIWQAIEDERKYMKEPSLETGRRIDAFFKRMLDGVSGYRTRLKSVMVTWKREDARQREAERQETIRKAREDAERERQRQADELAARAAEAEKHGDHHAAEELLEEATEIESRPALAVIPPAPPEPPKSSSSMITTKTGTVTSPAQMLAFLIGMDVYQDQIERYIQSLEPDKDAVMHARASLAFPLAVRVDLIKETIEFKQGGIDKALNRGVEIPGIEVELKDTITNRA